MAHPRDCAGDAAAYALGALEPVEVDAFVRHLDGCIVCRDEVTALGRVADALPMSALQHAVPGGLRRRVLRDVRTEPKLARAAAQRRRPRAPLLTRVSVPRPAVVASALLATIVILAGGLGLVSGSPSSGPRVISAKVVANRGTAQLRVEHGDARLIVRHLAPPPPGRIYEVWLVKRSHRAPSPTSSLFSVNSSGADDVAVPGPLRGVTEVMVTPEPAPDGSDVPTSPPVITAPLS